LGIGKLFFSITQRSFIIQKSNLLTLPNLSLKREVIRTQQIISAGTTGRTFTKTDDEKLSANANINKRVKFISNIFISVD